MARPPSGIEHIEAAKALLKTAKSADDLRLAQAVLLPLEPGLSLEQTAACIGRSVGATCAMRTRFAKVLDGKQAAPRSKTQLRNRAVATLDKEAQALESVMSSASVGGIIVIPRLHQDIQSALGKQVALSTVYRMLERHGYRKLAPDTRHPQGNPALREEWKKNSQTIWCKSPPVSRNNAP
jgi:Winged helix-turn helix